ncbi:WD40-repeat-containing domain protein [Naviculisporaceae sp. PSN 640]
MRRPSSSSTLLASSHLRPHRPGSVTDGVGPAPPLAPSASSDLHPAETAPTTDSSFIFHFQSQPFISSSASGSITRTDTGLASSSAYQGDDGDLLMTYDADEEDQEEHDQEYLPDQDLDHKSRNSELETWYYNLASHHHHHHPADSLGPQSVPLDDPNDYISDEHDSDNAGAPLMSYMDVLNLLVNGMDSEMAPDDLDANLDLDIDNSDISDHGDEDTDYHWGHVPPYQPSHPNDGGVTNLYELTPGEPPNSLPHPQSLPPVPTTAQMLAMLDGPGPDNTAVGSEWFETEHPPVFSNPNPNMLGPGNYGLVDFLHRWARESRTMQAVTRDHRNFPWPNKTNELAAKEVTRIEYDELEGDFCDVQGIDWADIGVTRSEAREQRLRTYNNYVNNEGSDVWTRDLPDIALPPSDSFFRFRRMDVRPGINLAHFQLRNVLATTSRTRTFYPGYGAVHQFNPISQQGRIVMDLGDGPGSQVSTMAAGHGVLVAGVFNGEYVLRHMDSDEPEATACHEGVITAHNSGITNHAQVYQSRTSSSPLVAFASNDLGFRILDIATERWLSTEMFSFALNCTAISPDKRLRVVVGDNRNVLIVASESTLSGGKPEVLQELTGHRDFGFACDWSDDGWTVATACQDKSVKIWDARRWCDSSGRSSPVCTIRAEMAGVRNLRFSPVGSGKRVLVAAEEADFVNIIDAETFASKQTFDVFGELGGVSFTNEGHELTVLCCDRTRGGLIQLERSGFNEECMWPMDEEVLPQRYTHRSGGLSYDYTMSSSVLNRRARHILHGRRKAAAADMLEPF